MLTEFKQHINLKFPELRHHKVLVAVSGGVDSVVLVHLLHLNKIDIALVHCNFKLRSEQSDQDQAFVKQLALQLDVPFFTQDFNTAAEAEKNKESIQLTARKLRYEWFEKIAKENGYYYVATAHHLNDSLENYLMHSTRGTGLKGLLGVPEQNQNIIRPLLPFTKHQIENTAKSEGWEWREDASNQKNTYFRNRIRNTIIPLLEEENPNLLASFQQTQSNLQQSHDLLEDYSALLYKELISYKQDFYSLNLNKLQQFPNPNAILYQLLYPFGFTDWESVYALRTAETGKKITSNTHILEKNREEFLIFVNHNEENENLIHIPNADKVVKFANSFLHFEEVNAIEEIHKHIAYVDIAKLKFPLRLRKVNNEDYFFPLGMKRNKKVNHFLRDEKVPTSIKKQTWVLCDENAIVWVVNHRINEKYKVTEKTKKCLKISCLKN